MSEKKRDQHGRWRNVTVAFRVSPEEAALIDAQVAMSGLTKQEYIVCRLLDREVRVIPSSRVQRALREEMKNVCLELRRIRDGSEISPELEAVIALLAEEYAALGGERSDVEREDEAIMSMNRVGGQTLTSSPADPNQEFPNKEKGEP